MAILSPSSLERVQAWIENPHNRQSEVQIDTANDVPVRLSEGNVNDIADLLNMKPEKVLEDKIFQPMAGDDQSGGVQWRTYILDRKELSRRLKTNNDTGKRKENSLNLGA